MKFFDFISSYFWLVCIGVIVVNYLLAVRARNAEEIHAVRQLRRKYLGWFYGLSVVPWLIVGYAQLVGEVPKIWAYFRPQDRNPYVWTFYASILLVYVIGAYWVLFRDGARIAAELRLVQYNAQGKSGALSAVWIKVIAVAIFPFFAFWLWVASLMNVQIP